MKAIIFGSNGQDGYYLTSLLSGIGIETIGVSRSHGCTIQGDVTDRSLVEKLVKDHVPEFIFHLAANSTTRHDALFENQATISNGSLNILHSVYSFSRETRVFLSGSGLQFKNKGRPISENDEFEARDAYSLARIQSVYSGRYFRRLGCKVYVGYFFHHDSPRRSERHINKRITEFVKSIAQGHDGRLAIGDVTVRKEFNFAGDTVQALWMLVNQASVFEAVIGSGVAYSIEDWLECCFSRIHRNWKDYVDVEPGFKPEFDVLVSNPETIQSLGWKPRVSFQQLAGMMLD